MAEKRRTDSYLPKKSVRQYQREAIRVGNCLVHPGQRISRYIYQLLRGPLTSNQFVCHRCDNPHCIRMSHLFVGSAKENRLDAQKKGRLNVPKSMLTRQRMSETWKRLCQDPAILEQRSKNSKAYWSTAKAHENLSTIMKKKWSDPTYKLKVSRNISIARRRNG